MKPFRLRIGKYARVFVRVNTLTECAVLRLRGYTPHPLGGDLWSKPNIHQRALERDNNDTRRTSALRAA